MDASKIAALGLFGLAAFNAYQAYQSVTAVPEESITPANCLTTRQGEKQGYRSTLTASALALGGLYLWMRK